MRNPPLDAPKAPAWPRSKRPSSASCAFGASLAKVPLAVLVSIVPFTFATFVGPAGADTVADCQAAFASSTQGSLVYTTDPPTRLAFTGQTVSLSAGWNPAEWDSLSAAAACVRFDENTFDSALGAVEASPANGGVFDHSFTIPQVAHGTRLCTRISLKGDPVGVATEAAWVSKMHCFEVDHDVEEETPPDDTAPPTTQPPAPTTTTTAPTAAPAGSLGGPGGDVPAADSPPNVPISPGGGDSAVGTPFDSAESAPPGPARPAPGPTNPENLPLLPATGSSASLSLLQQGGLCLLLGLALLTLSRLPRRRRQVA